ncbi:ribosomal-protein-alanine N-acetyltransferase [Paenibacillus phyllosphaerae]|uniref:Ribosomal-protein-alanine N-acetyltransferase n=1 Tax=Paenibacillus phyllosphaerae TaxID=274593 RepID=A0A7W5FPN5_9BACL|nr:GNAT family protein [Paenibacillus phyllosphaerae]MBB3112555.1 ribosomal-protein-alanine N-acetyltransferase [Paenibacillus phyllosphaerae]
MPTFPRLETKRLVLRKMVEEDAPAMFDYFSKDEVTQYYDLESFTEVKQASDLIAMFNQRYEEGKGYRWGITLKGAEDQLLGSCGFHQWEKEHYRAELGYELAPAYWQRGIMTEAASAIIAYGFESLGLNRINAYIDPANISSHKLLKKVGFAEEGLLRDYFYEKGKFVDAVIFGQLKRDYEQRRG